MSKVHAVLGGLVLVLAPIAFLTGLILMLRVLRSSLPGLAAATATDPATPADARPRNLLDHLGSALAPFLAVYASMGYLCEDGADYLLLFCLAFLVAQGAADWLWEPERLVIGPRELNGVWMPLFGPLDMINRMIGTVLLACLLAAAVDRVLRYQPVVPD